VVSTRFTGAEGTRIRAASRAQVFEGRFGTIPTCPFVDPTRTLQATGGLDNVMFDSLRQRQLQGFAKRAKTLNLEPPCDLGGLTNRHLERFQRGRLQVGNGLLQL
jgi:hypothetical protein